MYVESTKIELMSEMLRQMRARKDGEVAEVICGREKERECVCAAFRMNYHHWIHRIQYRTEYLMPLHCAYIFRKLCIVSLCYAGAVFFYSPLKQGKNIIFNTSVTSILSHCLSIMAFEFDSNFVKLDFSKLNAATMNHEEHRVHPHIFSMPCYSVYSCT